MDIDAFTLLTELDLQDVEELDPEWYEAELGALLPLA